MATHTQHITSLLLALFALVASKPTQQAGQSENVLDQVEVSAAYPTERVQAALARAPVAIIDYLRQATLSNRIVKRSVETTTTPTTTTPHHEDFTRRICEVKDEDFHPHYLKTGRQEDPTKYTIVNLPNFVQTVHTKECLHHDGHNKATYHMNQHDHMCKQETIEVPLVYMLEGAVDKVAIKTFSIPHGCSCYLKS
jgi:hypothetical protein